MTNENPCVEHILALSTAHLPNTNPDFGDLRVSSFEYGYVVWVTGKLFGDWSGPDKVVDGIRLLDPTKTIPEWLIPAMTKADDAGCTLILFDRDGLTDPDLPTWDW
jgi:hypothetical protein